ncbi:hypothetical protein [Kribbella sp. NPDC051620]|uniref:hypothetical protein n=1 Tax=Kribbella sp. NPDC051620 TaxID=3364120 RepID=UPI0037AF9020
MTSVVSSRGRDVRYGRDDETWDRMVEEGTLYLEDVARDADLTSYSALNAELVHGPGCRPFDFEQAADRAAVGYLLGRIVDHNYSRIGLMLSALVRHIDANEAGPGFSQLAQQMNLLDKNASRAAKREFWIGHVAQLHALYRGPSAS